MGRKRTTSSWFVVLVDLDDQYIPAPVRTWFDSDGDELAMSDELEERREMMSVRYFRWRFFLGEFSSKAAAEAVCAQVERHLLTEDDSFFRQLKTTRAVEVLVVLASDLDAEALAAARAGIAANTSEPESPLGEYALRLLPLTVASLAPNRQFPRVGGDPKTTGKERRARWVARASTILMGNSGISASALAKAVGVSHSTIVRSEEIKRLRSYLAGRAGERRDL